MQPASQQLPEPTTAVIPSLAVQRAASDFVEQWFRTGGHVELSVHAVTPSSQRLLVHVPGEHCAHVMKPDFFPHVERAAQRVTAPLQFTSRSPFRTAALTARATQLTYWPWFPVQVHDRLIVARTVATRESLQPAFARDVVPSAATRARTKTVGLMPGSPFGSEP
jgi:hypothetical protein